MNIAELITHLAQPQFFYVLLSLFIYTLGGQLQKKTGWFIFNPLLFASVVIMIILMVFDIPYEDYAAGGQYISIFLNLATVSLAILLEKNWKYLKMDMLAIITGVSIGVILNAIILVVLSSILGLDAEMTITLMPKSITTAIAQPMSISMGGIGSLTVGFAIISCLIGNVFGPGVLKALKIDNPIAQGAALGGSSAAMGVAASLNMGSLQGSIGSTGLVLAGVISVPVLPIVWNLLSPLLF